MSFRESERVLFMAKNPKCKHCQQEILDKTLATKKSNGYYHNSCLEEMELAKRKYKPQENTPRRQFTDMVVEYYVNSGYDKNLIQWNTIQSQANKLMKENSQYTYPSMTYTLWYAMEIEQAPISDDRGIIGLIEFNFDKAKKYYNELEEIKKSIDEFEFEDKVVVVNKSFSKKKKYKELTFD